MPHGAPEGEKILIKMNIRNVYVFVLTMMLGFDLHQNENLCTTRFPVTSLFEKNIFFSKSGHVIYRWKRRVALNTNHNRTWG